MKTNLHILIEELQRECCLLEEKMIECVEEEDFKGAESYREPLYYTRDKLNSLKVLRDPNLHEISRLKHEIDFYEDTIAKGKHPNYYPGLLKELEKKLNILTDAKSENKVDSDELITCLENMACSKLDSFEIEFGKDNYSIIIEKKDDSLNYLLKTINSQPLGHFIPEPNIVILKKLGFALSNSKGFLELKNFDKAKILTALEILSSIVFDVLELNGDNHAVIKL